MNGPLTSPTPHSEETLRRHCLPNSLALTLCPQLRMWPLMGAEAVGPGTADTGCEACPLAGAQMQGEAPSGCAKSSGSGKLTCLRSHKQQAAEPGLKTLLFQHCAHFPLSCQESQLEATAVWNLVGDVEVWPRAVAPGKEGKHLRSGWNLGRLSVDLSVKVRGEGSKGPGRCRSQGRRGV